MTAMGGPEWCGRLPPQEPPDSGDLALDVPVLCKQIVTRAEQAEARADAAEREGLLLFGKVLHEFYRMRFGNRDEEHLQRMAEQWPTLAAKWDAAPAREAVTDALQVQPQTSLHSGSAADRDDSQKRNVP